MRVTAGVPPHSRFEEMQCPVDTHVPLASIVVKNKIKNVFFVFDSEVFLKMVSSLLGQLKWLGTNSLTNGTAKPFFWPKCVAENSLGDSGCWTRET